MTRVQVLILMGSESDAPTMKAAADVLRELGVSYEMTVASAHRSPARVERLLADSPARGVQVFIAGAGASAHLAGMVAAHTIKPVIGVPINATPLAGVDALLSTVQMPPGVPVATMAVGTAGAVNAGVLAAQMIALGDPDLASRLEAYKARLAENVEEAAARIEAGSS
jgi:phosphoribosylaminoimidazole carboxylase PurE protein